MKILFLIIRVELKRFIKKLFTFLSITVPNHPCGVETVQRSSECVRGQGVPNHPCGVETLSHLVVFWRRASVPNHPCGVETHQEVP